MFTGSCNRFWVLKNDASVPWPMAFGSVAARLVCSPYITLSLSPSSVLQTNVGPLCFEMFLYFINENNSENFHTQKQFLYGE